MIYYKILHSHTNLDNKNFHYGSVLSHKYKKIKNYINNTKLKIIYLSDTNHYSWGEIPDYSPSLSFSYLDQNIFFQLSIYF